MVGQAAILQEDTACQVSLPLVAPINPLAQDPGLEKLCAAIGRLRFPLVDMANFMKKHVWQPCLELFLARLPQGFRVELFGSASYLLWLPSSDFDIAFFSPAGHSWQATRQQIYEIAQQTPLCTKVSMFVYPRHQHRIRCHDQAS